jgi:hypothetical protein
MKNGTLNPSSPITSANSTTAASVSSSANAAHPNNSASKKVGKKKENLDDLNWLRECELRQTITSVDVSVDKIIAVVQIIAQGRINEDMAMECLVLACWSTRIRMH